MIHIDFGNDFQNKSEIEQVSLDDAGKNEVANLLRDEWRSFTTAIRPLLDESVVVWRHYSSTTPMTAGPMTKNTNKGGKNNKKSLIKLGNIGRAVDAVVAIQHNTTFPAEEQFFYGIPTDDFSEEMKVAYEGWASTNIAQANFKMECLNLRKCAFIDGTGFAEIKYARKKGKKISYEPETIETAYGDSPDLGLNKRVEKDDVKWEGTALKTLNFHDCRVDPFCDNFDDSPFLRRWYEPTWKVKRDYKLDKKVESYKAARDAYDEQGRRDKIESLGITWSFDEVEGPGISNALLMCRYGDFVVNDEVYENHCALVLNDTEVLWFGPNPYDHGLKPYVAVPYHTVPGTIYGKSGVKDCIGSAEAVDRSVTQTLDIGEWAASPVFTKDIRDEAVKAQGDLVVSPGVHIPVMSGEPYKQLQINTNNAMGLLNLMTMLESSIQETTGATPAFSGESVTSGGDQPTAFQVGQSVQGGNSRHQLNMTIFNEMVLQRFIEMKFENDRQYMSKSYTVDGQAGKLTPEAVQRMDLIFTLTAGKANSAKNEALQNQVLFIDKVLGMIAGGAPIQLKQDSIYEFDLGGSINNIAKEVLPNAEQAYKEVAQPQPGEAGDMGGVAGVLPPEQGIPPELLAAIAGQSGIPQPPL